MIALPVAFLIGCASEPTPDMLPGGQPTFDSYAIQAKAYVAERRHFVTDDHVAEIEGNSPFEIQPKNPNGQASEIPLGRLPISENLWPIRDT